MTRTAASLLLLVGCANATVATDASTGDAGDDTMSAPNLVRIDIAPQAAIPKGLQAQLAATGTYSDGSTMDLTGSVTWSATDSSIATIDAGGLVHAVAVGSTEVDAALDSVTGKTNLEVATAIVVSIAITPDPLTLPLGVTRPLTATGTLSDASMADVTAMATWTVATGTAVTVDATGAVHAVAQGPATVHATIASAIGSVDATVGPAIADHVALSTGDFTLAQQQRAHVRAKLVYTDQTSQDVTATATWSSNSGAVTVSAGQVDAQTTGSSATVTATASGLSASVHVTVSTAACHPVINEVQAGSAAANDEWAEIYNPCTVSIAVAGWTLDYRASTNTGATDNNLLATLTGTMAPGELRLYAGLGYTATPDAFWGGGSSGLLQATNGALGLRSGPKDTGPLVDAVGYGTLSAGHPFIEGTTAPALANGKSASRLPFDGNDTNDGATNFSLVAAPTPRALNAP